jgi:hypothetical protein
VRAVEELRRVGPFGDGSLGDIDSETIEYGAPLAKHLESSTSCFPTPAPLAGEYR